MTKYIIFLTAISAFAQCNQDCEFRKINALERIASALERIALPYAAKQLDNVYKPDEPSIKKTYPSHVNGRSLKAIPTSNVLEVEECVEKCLKEKNESLQQFCIQTKCTVGDME